jgi:hypothetical protein
VEQSLADFEQLAVSIGVVMGHNKLTSIALAQNNPCRACQHALHGLNQAQKLDHQMWLGLGIEHTAMLVAQHNAALATRLFGCAEAQLATTRSHMAPIDQPIYDQAIAVVRAQLGKTTFTAAWEEGRMLPLEQATALAMEAWSRSRLGVPEDAIDV